MSYKEAFCHTNPLPTMFYSFEGLKDLLGVVLWHTCPVWRRRSSRMLLYPDVVMDEAAKYILATKNNGIKLTLHQHWNIHTGTNYQKIIYIIFIYRNQSNIIVLQCKVKKSHLKRQDGYGCFSCSDCEVVKRQRCNLSRTLVSTSTWD